MEKYYVSIQNCRIAKNRSEVSNYYEFETVMNAEQKQQLETLLLESGVKEIYQFLIGVATAEDKAYIKTILGDRKMITRKEYMSGKFTHREYYGQFVTESVKALVRKCIGEQVIKRSEDSHLNDIPLQQWDHLHPAILSICGKAIASTTTGGVSLSDTVCIAKEAAKQIQIGRAVFPAPKIKGDEPMCDTPFYKWLEENKVDKFVDAIKQHLTPLGFDIKAHILEEEVLNSYKCVYEHFWWSYYHKGDKKS